MQFLEGSVKLTIEEALNMGFLSQSDVEFATKLGMNCLILSHECMQDMLLKWQNFSVNRAGKLNQEDVKSWNMFWEKIKNLNFDEVIKRYKVKFEQNYEVYQDEC